MFLCFRCWYSMKTRYVVLRTPKYFIVRCLFKFMRSCFVLLEIHSLFQIPLWKASFGGSCFFSIKNPNLRNIQIAFIAANVILRVSSSKKLYGSFLWTEMNCLKSTEPLQGGSLLFITQFRKIPGTHLINLGKMKGWLDLGGATPWFSTQDHWIGDPAP